MKRLLKRLIYRIRGEVTTEELIKNGLRVGKNFRRNEHCIIDESHCWLISIGDDVVLAPRVHILAHDASMWNDLGYTKIAETKIGNNVFIGAGSIIMPGVEIGDNSIVGAGSVVTKHVPSDTVVAGNPARTIMSKQDFIEKHKNRLTSAPLFSEEYTLRNKRLSNEMKRNQFAKIRENGKDGGYVE